MTFEEFKNSFSRIICIEGLDGSGKETQAKRLVDKLNDLGYSAIYVSFPNYESWSSDMIKHYLKGEVNKDMPYQIISEMFALDFALTWHQKIKKYVEMGYIIVCDRYVPSSMIYQSVDCETEEQKKEAVEFIYKLNYIDNKLPEPDLTIFLDISYNVMMDNINKRMEKDPSHNDCNEGNAERMKKIYDNYQWMINNYSVPMLVKCDDGERMKSVEQIGDDIIDSVLKYVGDSKLEDKDKESGIND